MKSNTFIGFAFLLMVCLYLLVMRIEPMTFGDIARFIPADSIGYFEQRDGIRALNKFARSPLGQKIDGLKIRDISSRIGLSDTAQLKIENAKKAYHKLRKDKLAAALLGKHFAIALLAPLEGQNPGDIEEFVLQNMLLISEPKQNNAFLQFLAEGYARYEQSLTVTKVQYGNHTIRRIERDGQFISLVSIDGFFLFSYNEWQLRKCIDAFDGDIPSVNDEKSFSATSGQLSNPERFLFCSLDVIRATIPAVVENITFPLKDLLQKEISATSGFNSFAYGARSSRGRVIDKVVVYFTPEQLSGEVRSHLTVAPAHCPMFGLTTARPMLYYWSNTLNFKYFIPYFNISTDAETQPYEFNAKIRSVTGRNVNDILALFGDNVSLHIEKGATGGLGSSPLAMLFVQVNDRVEIQRIIDALIHTFNIPTRTKSYRNLYYTYWSLSPEDGLQPLYGFWGNILFIGNSSKLLQRIIDFQQTGKTLVRNDGVKKNDPGLEKKNNSVTYLNNGEFIDLVKKMSNLVGTIVAIEDKAAAYRARIIINDILHPILEGAKMYNTSVSRSYFSSNTVVIESITRVRNPTDNKRTK